ncbi:hypothetical protein [Photobacterium phosphoreum]|uniref:hypothetical protein n=1 Tax=Photobacterium phosphoreum TaxID=659 RepID=UPI0024B6C154|nr:hypothetical protein [Photobacterium phosphoreum]
MENNKKFIERYLKTLNVYLDDKQSKNFNRMLGLYESVKDLDNEINDLENEHLLLKDKQINIEIGIHELKKRIANKQLAKEANIIELEKTIKGK